MLQRIDKIAPYALVLILGYMTYSMMESTGPSVAEAKQPPTISNSLLEPELITPKSHASPADRDPFEVEWSSYLRSRRGRSGRAKASTSQPATKAASQPAKALATKPPEVKPPKFPGLLAAVIIGEDVQLAVIGQSLYKPGMLIGGTDPKKCWVVESIRQGSVIIAFGQIRRTLRLHSGTGRGVGRIEQETQE